MEKLETQIEAQKEMIKIAVDALTELSTNPNRKDVDLFASRTLDKMKEAWGSVAEIEVSLCQSCYCVTKTILGKCGKCREKKI